MGKLRSIQPDPIITGLAHYVVEAEYEEPNARSGTITERRVIDVFTNASSMPKLEYKTFKL